MNRRVRPATSQDKPDPKCSNYTYGFFVVSLCSSAKFNENYGDEIRDNEDRQADFASNITLNEKFVLPQCYYRRKNGILHETNKYGNSMSSLWNGIRIFFSDSILYEIL